MNKVDTKKKFNKKIGGVRCHVCGKPIYSSDFPDVEYIRTRRKTDIFIHSECVKKGR